MRVLDGSQFLVRIFLGESDRFHHTLSQILHAVAWRRRRAACMRVVRRQLSDNVLCILAHTADQR